MHELTLYYRPTCPYCRKVLKFMEDNGVGLPMTDVSSDQRKRQELVSIGGKGQVPCLVIDGQALYESDDIIKWLKGHWKKQ